MSYSNNEFLLWEVEEWDGQFTRIDSYLAGGLLSNCFSMLELPAHDQQVSLLLLTTASHRVPRAPLSGLLRPRRTPLLNSKLHSRNSSPMLDLFAKMEAISSLGWKMYDILSKQFNLAC